MGLDDNKGALLFGNIFESVHSVPMTGNLSSEASSLIAANGV